MSKDGDSVAPVQRIDRIRRTVRRLVIAGVLLGVAWFTYRYDVYTIPEDYHGLEPQHMGPGTKVVMTDVDDDTVLGPGSIVLFRVPGAKTDAFGVIVGMPGEMVRIEDLSRGRARVMIEDREEDLVLPPGSRLKQGPIPDAHFLIFSGDRHLVVNAIHPDSRIFGPIPRGALRKKVVTSLWFLN
ncbi:MAG TPA: hypothetical protein ENK43_12175 [Planctomycetes bacterium]|nr:hypothetical protein [Planctomycetota bacterium]